MDAKEKLYINLNSSLLDSSMNANAFSLERSLPVIIIALDLKMDSAAPLLGKARNVSEWGITVEQKILIKGNFFTNLIMELRSSSRIVFDKNSALCWTSTNFIIKQKWKEDKTPERNQKKSIYKSSIEQVKG